MNVLKAVLKHDVYPALGCTEPIAVAYAASIAGKQLSGEITEIQITVDPGVYKNGFAVTIPNTGGERGNLIAGVLGALIQQPELKMELLKGVTEDTLRRAKALIHSQRASLCCDKSRKRLYIDAFLRAGKNTARAVIENSHTNLIRLQHNQKDLLLQKNDMSDASTDEGFRSVLRNSTVSELIDMAQGMDDQDYDYIKRGIDMNLRISEEGYALKKVSYYISELVAKRYRVSDVSSSCEVLTTSATDARMAGLNLPVMSSGGSGNQGIVAILVPYFVGTQDDLPERTIVHSIGVSHLLNSYIKCFTGDLSPLCGCAIAAGVGAAVAIVFQQAGKNMHKITLAVNNLISDLGGMLCDGAKGGCALKVASSTNSAIRSAYMALNGHGITQTDGFVGDTAEDTIRNLSAIGNLGMSLVDDTMLEIMKDKASRRTTCQKNQSLTQDNLSDDFM
ncbi:MAG: L-serine ammonia-lyase, iron-sulfur-dependent, subunit alpha [Desulfatirhabdiaceae bacterium]